MRTLAATLAACLLLPAGAALGASILLAPSTESTINVTARLTSLGHTVTVGNPATWGSGFDYSAFDVVAFQFSSANPADIPHLVAAVDAGQVGVVFFRGYGTENTALALGLVSGGAPILNWQTPTSLNVAVNSHYITQGMSLGVHALGYDYMSRVQGTVGANATTLATGTGGAALVVHNTRRAVITPFYGHPSNYASENATGLDVTQRSIVWAAGDQRLAARRTSWAGVKSLYRR